MYTFRFQPPTSEKSTLIIPEDSDGVKSGGNRDISDRLLGAKDKIEDVNADSTTGSSN